LVLLEGELRGRREADGPDSPVISVQAPTVTGLLPFSRLKVVPLTTRALGRLRTLAFPASKFPEMLQRMPELAQGLVALMTDRVRNYTVVGQQRDKLAALGKLSAGLAHELNNPSAAARRSAAALRDCLARLRETGRSSSIGPDDCALLAKREEEIRGALKPPEYKDEFERVERQEALQAWLESRSVKDAWKLAPLLADANLTDAQLDSFAAAAGSSQHLPHLRSHQGHKGIFLHGSGFGAGSRCHQRPRKHAYHHESQTEAWHRGGSRICA
jgi:hypothetical protein